MVCLHNPGATPVKCRRFSHVLSVNSAPTNAPTQPHRALQQGHAGRRPAHSATSSLSEAHRQLQHSIAAQPACHNGGLNVTCNDEVRNGNEIMADCGGGCTRNQGRVCAAGAAAAVRGLTATGPAQPGKFEVLLPVSISAQQWGECGPAKAKSLVARSIRMLRLRLCFATLLLCFFCLLLKKPGSSMVCRYSLAQEWKRYSIIQERCRGRDSTRDCSH